MASFPKIESPCPLRVTVLPSAGKDFCSMCERKVHNLSAMNQFERSVFMRSCTGKVCVAYSIPVASTKTLAIAGVSLGMAMLLGAGSALAGDSDAAAQFDPAQKPESLLQTDTQEKNCDDDEMREEIEEESFILIGGGISSPQDAEWVDADDILLAKIPTIAADALLDEKPDVTFGTDPADRDPAFR